MASIEISASEFKAKCLDLFDQISRGELDDLVITKRGKPVARVVAPPSAAALRQWHGSMRGTFEIAPGVDLTEPVYNEPWDAELGIIHN